MALLGAIIGDIIGSQYEFPSMRPDDLDWEFCKLFSTECEFTDDTVLSIATKFAIDNKMRFNETYRKFSKMYPEKGYGDMFLNWIESGILQYSYGNGSAMRVSPIIDYYSKCKINNNIIFNIKSLARITAKYDHSHPEGIKGASVVAVVGYMASQNKCKKEIYEYVKPLYNDIDYAYPVSMSMNDLRKKYQWSSTCQNTVPVAIRCFLDSTDYESCIRNCLSLPCDMDTMCCIAGGIAEAFYGTTGFNNKAILQKYLDNFLYKCIEDIL